MMIGGVRVIIEPSVDKETRWQFRKPKSRSKRIRKKWAKRPTNWRSTWERRIFKAHLPGLYGESEEVFLMSAGSWHELKNQITPHEAAAAGMPTRWW